MQIRFWGTRGSIPTPDRRTNYFGGNTSCVEIRGADDRLIILDCGTGARPLGLDILGRGEKLQPMHILITHTHWDHIQGFPFFLPAYVPGARLTFYGTRGLERTLEASISGQMQHTYFPVQLGELRAQIDFIELAEQRFTLGPLRVTTQFMNHTAATIGYRFECGGLKFTYCTDHEPFWWPSPAPRPGDGNAARHPGEDRHIAFIEGADLLIHDAQYSDHEYSAKRGWGHSPIEYVVEIAARAGVKQLILFHHDPLHSDDWVRRHTEAARRQARRLRSPLEILAASEGLEINLDERHSPGRPGANGSARPALSSVGGRILVAGSSAETVKELRDILAGDGYDIAMAGDRHLGSAVTRRRPHLLILVGARSEAALLETVQQARAEAWGASLPVLILAGSEGPGPAGRLVDALTDVLSRPLNPAFLRPRVRAWLSRAGVAVPARGDLHRQRIVSASLAAGRGFLTGLPLAERATLLTSAKTARFRLGEILFKQGEPAGGLYFLRSGRVRLTVRRNGREVVVATARVGDTVGELAAVDGGPRTATARAIEATTADYISREAFAASLAAAPAAAARLIRRMAQRLRQTDPYVGELTSVRAAASDAPTRGKPDSPRRR